MTQSRPLPATQMLLLEHVRLHADERPRRPSWHAMSKALRVQLQLTR
eukprot:CAMPEP_0170381758 /NCGR_PEP_ID=MMETSP0117_2-20130122/14579_1 /TAXON_ID=400756 /ORGANISM="Durinskia baltica, Strain CSIRO CS-38" /LENGTH=46 /DNA_ID= /DNA_START= /DNA_END= /DNA_ORIENTATION=